MLGVLQDVRWVWGHVCLPRANGIKWRSPKDKAISNSQAPHMQALCLQFPLSTSEFVFEGGSSPVCLSGFQFRATLPWTEWQKKGSCQAGTVSTARRAVAFKRPQTVKRAWTHMILAKFITEGTTRNYRQPKYSLTAMDASVHANTMWSF